MDLLYLNQQQGMVPPSLIRYGKYQRAKRLQWPQPNWLRSAGQLKVWPIMLHVVKGRNMQALALPQPIKGCVRYPGLPNPFLTLICLRVECDAEADGVGFRP